MRQYKQVKVGDTVRVQFKTLEEDAERLQNFEGTLIKVRGTGVSQTLTVRKISFGVGVERIFPVESPRFVGISVTRRGKVRRSKLYYMRGLTGKSHRVAFQGDETDTDHKPKLLETPASKPETPIAPAPAISSSAS